MEGQSSNSTQTSVVPLPEYFNLPNGRKIKLAEIEKKLVGVKM